MAETYDCQNDAIEALWKASTEIKEKKEALQVAEDEQKDLILRNLSNLLDCGVVTVQVSKARLNQIVHNL